MNTALITGSGGLIGKESSEFFLKKGFRVVGVDNNMREYFFGKEGSVQSKIDGLTTNQNYKHVNADVRTFSELEKIFQEYGKDITLIIHCAAQPSHDWAVKEVFTDFNVNVVGTLNLLELTRKYCPKACFIYMSTNKVYGDNPNRIELVEKETRFDVPMQSEYSNGFNETFSLDRCIHSLFGCSKLSADVYVQEYGKYFGMNTSLFRGGCLTGSKHSGAELHGFLNYLVKCNVRKIKYNIFGYKGKQVRDNIHSSDLVNAFWEVYKSPKQGEVYNIGGGLYSNCSILEAINIVEKLSGIPMEINYIEKNRIGDHMWWISDLTKFKTNYVNWDIKYNIESIIEEIMKNM